MHPKIMLFALLILSKLAIAQDWKPIGVESFEGIYGVVDGALLLIRYPGDILRSTDTGETWSVVFRGGDRVSGIAYSGPELVAREDSDHVIISADSGRSWTVREEFHSITPAIGPPPSPLPSTSSGQALLASSQEGEFQRLHPIPEGTNSVGYADSACWVVGEPGMIARWDGTKWRELHRAPYPVMDRDSSLVGIDFASPEFGALIRQHSIYFTYDSGVTWRESIPDSAPGSAHTTRSTISSIFFIDDTGVLVGMSDGKLLFRSRSSGVWVQDTQIQNSHPILSIGWQDEYARQIFVLTDSELFTISADLQVATSSPLPIRSGERVRGLQFLNSYVGFLLTDSTTHHDTMTAERKDTTLLFDTSTIYRSLDGGGTWSAIVRGISGITSVSFLSPRHGEFCTRSGLIEYTNDSGSTWLRNWNATRKRLRDIQYVNDSVGFAVGDSGTVIFTSNYGESWRPLPPDPLFFHPSESYSAIAFPTPQTVWIAGATKGYHAPIKIPARYRISRRITPRASLSISVYPDPSSGPVTFDIRLSGRQPQYEEVPTLRICDLSGKSVFEGIRVQTVSSSEWSAEADLSFLQAGVYTVAASYGGQTSITKFLIAK